MICRTLHSITLAAAVLSTTIPALCAVSQSRDSEAQPPPRIGVMTRHGLAGVVTSITGSQLVMQIPENVPITVQIGPSTRISDLGQDATLGAIHVGSAIFASGDLNEDTRIIRAQVITIQPGAAAQMLENRRANFGRTWTAGLITALQGESITVKRMDGQSQTFTVGQDTVWRFHDQPATSSMARVGERITVQLRPDASLAIQVSIAGMAQQH